MPRFLGLKMPPTLGVSARILFKESWAIINENEAGKFLGKHGLVNRACRFISLDEVNQFGKTVDMTNYTQMNSPVLLHPSQPLQDFVHQPRKKTRKTIACLDDSMNSSEATESFYLSVNKGVTSLHTENEWLEDVKCFSFVWLPFGDASCLV